MTTMVFDFELDIR